MSQDPLTAALRDARLPRYTSFPPANRFTDTVGPDEAARWIAEVPVELPLSLYLHVPFCRKLCWFCACRTQGTQSNEPLDRDQKHLAKETVLVGELPPQGVEASRLHPGGGKHPRITS